MNVHRPLTRLAHELLTPYLSTGDIAVDATAGNGHDTLFLAQQVGPTGRVHAFDIQSSALDSTRERLRQAACETPLRLHPVSHAEMLHQLPTDLRGRVAAITFNLGYLPGADRQTVTHSESTLAALRQSLLLLRPGGALSVLAYRGHPGGREEALAVGDWCEQEVTLDHQAHESPGPILHFCTFRNEGRSPGE